MSYDAYFRNQFNKSEIPAYGEDTSLEIITDEGILILF